MSFFPRVRIWSCKTSEELFASEAWKNISAQTEWYPKGVRSHFLLMFPQMMAAGGGVAAAFPPGYQHIHMVYEDRYMRCMYDPRDFELLANKILEKIDAEPTWTQTYERTFIEATQKLIPLATQIFLEGGKDQPREMLKQLIEVIDVGVVPQSYGYLTETFTLTRKEYWVTKRLQELAPELSEEERTTLMHPTRPSFLQEYERMIHEAKTEEEYQAAWKRFYWVKGSYEALPDFTVEHLKSEAAQPPHNLFDASILAKKRVLIERAAEQEKLKDFVAFIEMSVALQDERKANVLRLNYAIYRLIKALQVHYPSWSIDELLSFSPLEIAELVEGGLSPAQREHIQARNHQSVWVGTPKWYAITTDKEAYTKIKGLLEEDTQTVKGYVAFKGRVRGMAKVVLSSNEFDKVQPGDILVTSMTRPEFLPVMKRAAAFVTNEGGITCHAAIVARELQKPCIIGTRVATTLLKDGDMVEVDAEQGIVRVLA